MSKIVAVLVLFIGLSAQGQSEMKTKKGFLFTPHVAFHRPGNDLADRFKNFASLGLTVDFKMKSNLTIGMDYDWFFGNSIKEIGMFTGIDNPGGQIIDKNGDFSVIGLNIKGNYGTVHIGYLLNLPKDEPFSGILFTAGAGVMQHRIDIISSQVTIPQLNDAYEYGYDKLTYGLATKQFIGYQYLVAKNRYHFRAGFEFNQGFTQGRRTWDFNANKSGLDKRFDTTIAFKLGIVVPVYTKSAGDEEFFID
jgi:hypothetical protein